jgi:uncharacterized protein
MLKISKTLALPLSAVTQKIVVYGSPGMGKTNFGSVIAEELYANNLRFSVIDPMGVWWGLQHGITSKGGGLEVLLLGGIHGDLPIEPTGGEVVADLVADESVSVVIDISRTSGGKAWKKGEKIRFVTAYMTRLYERQVERRRPIMQIIDEAARYAPQTFVSQDKETPLCLGAIEMVCEEGRNLGIGIMLLTQRSARLSKSVAELAETMFAFRVVGPNSVGAVVDWFGEHVERERHKELVGQLRKLPIGSALLVSPGWLEYEGSIQLRARQTFDSSKTPEAGEDLSAPGKARKPDLEKYRERMAATIERAVADDPKTLKRQIAELKRQVDTRPKEVASEPVVKEIPILPAKEIDALTKEIAGFRQDYNSRLDVIAQGFANLNGSKHVERIEIAINKMVSVKIPVTPGRPVPQPVQRPAAQSRPVTKQISSISFDGDHLSLTKAEKQILKALYWTQSDGGQTPAKIGFYADYRAGTGSFNNALSSLRSKGLLVGWVITAEGERVASSYAEAKPAGMELREWLRPKLDKCSNEILDVLIGRYPNRLSPDEIAAETASGYKVGTGSFNNGLARLRSLEAAEGYGREGVKAADVFFE